jgi:hypothetical protein
VDPPRRGHEWTLWVVAGATVLHAAEEYLTGWEVWARDTLGIAMASGAFLAINAVLVLAALRLAALGWRRPALALVIPSATLVNALVFHILPTMVQGRASPGVYSAVLLYLPFSSWALVGAARDGVPYKAIAAGVAAGTIMMLAVVLGARAVSGAPG